MWIIIRLLFFVVGFLARLGKNVFPPKRFGELNGKTFFCSVSRGRSGRVLRYRVGTALKLPVVFRLQEEGALDGFFKSIGFAREFQTGDDHFDRNIYIASDHPALFEHLAQRDDARRLVHEAIQAGYQRVTADGRYLWLERKGNTKPSEADSARVDELHNAFKDIGRRIRLRSDPYALRVVLVEAISWGILLYAAATASEWLVDRSDIHVNRKALITAGLISAAFMLMLLLGVLRALLGQSARGHRILIEGVLVLAFGLPVAGISLVSELNRRLDIPTPTMMSREVARRYQTEHRGKGNSISYRYYVEFADRSTFGSTTLPSTVQVTRAQWQRLPQRGQVWHMLGRGALGLAWYRGFSPVP